MVEESTRLKDGGAFVVVVCWNLYLYLLVLVLDTGIPLLAFQSLSSLSVFFNRRRRRVSTTGSTAAPCTLANKARRAAVPVEVKIWHAVKGAMRLSSVSSRMDRALLLAVDG
jgi:hypothetical protein